MADKINEDSIGNTQFGASNPTGRSGPYFYPSGRLGQFIAKFFASKAQPYIANQTSENPTPQAPLAGDTVKQTDVVKAQDKMAMASINRREVYLPDLERNRRERYKQFEEMDDYPEVGAAFDIYADECTQKNLRNERWKVVSKSQLVVDEVREFFNTIQLDRNYWDIIRNTVKYGDCFIETVLDINAPKLGIQRIKVLNPNFIIRVENEYGYLTDFLQEIPRKEDWGAYGPAADGMRGARFINLDRNQIVHFRLRTSDPAYYPYGKSIAALAVRVYKSLKLMEDAMLIYRLSRAPERRIFYIDVANMPASKAEMYIERLKEKFKKEKFYDPNRNNVDARYNPLSADEDFFVPTRQGSNTKIETLAGAQNLGEVEDVQYFRDKLLACLKIPKDYVTNQHDKSPERKANLQQLDIKFARVIGRVQQQIETGLEQLAKRHLALRGFPASAIKELRIVLPEGSDQFMHRKLQVEESRSRVVQAVKGLEMFPKEYLYKEYYDMNEQQIDELMTAYEEEAEKEAEKEMAQQQQMAAQQAQTDQDGADAEAGRAEAGKQADFERDQAGKEADVDRQKELEKAKPSPKKEAVDARLVDTLNKVKAKMLEEGNLSTRRIESINRTISRIEEKLDQNQ